MKPGIYDIIVGKTRAYVFEQNDVDRKKPLEEINVEMGKWKSNKK